MSLVTKFADWFHKKDDRIMELHINKEREALKEEYNSLMKERKKMRDFINRLDALIDIEEKFLLNKEKGE